MSSLAARQPYSDASSPDLGGIRVDEVPPAKRAAISLSVNVHRARLEQGDADVLIVSLRRGVSEHRLRGRE